MALYFKGNRIPGTNGPIQVGSPEGQFRRHKYYGVKGEGEVIGGKGGRTLMVQHILHGEFDTYAKLEQAKDDLNSAIQENGTLEEESGDVEQTFKKVTFVGWEPLALEGQEAAGPLQDVTETLFDENGDADGGWFQAMTLTYRQLVVD